MGDLNSHRLPPQREQVFEEQERDVNKDPWGSFRGYGEVELKSASGRFVVLHPFSFSSTILHLLVLIIPSPPGKEFVARSIMHLSSTTFANPEDELSICALVAYLNAAFPEDRWREFDTGEVCKIVWWMHARKMVRLEGVVIRR
jgi:hypothetical protein